MQATLWPASTVRSSGPASVHSGLANLQRGEAAMTTHERVNGSNHPWTKASAHVTADALDALGRGAEAAALRENCGIVRADKI